MKSVLVRCWRKELTLKLTQYHLIQASVRRQHIQHRTMATTSPIVINSSNMSDIMKKYDTLLLDCDGVLWGSDHYTRFEGIGEAMQSLKSQGKNLYFVTNNSMHSREKYVEKIKDFTNVTVPKEDIFSVSYATALYAHRALGITNKCYIIGPLGLKTELENFGIKTIGFGADENEPTYEVDTLLKYPMDNDVEAVILGFDVYFNYIKMYKAASYLSNPKCHYIATNDKEVSVPIGEGRVQPLTAPIITAMNVASQREPIVIGKPHSHLLKCIQLEKPDLNIERCLMIGDSLKTDIPFGNDSGMHSAVVLTGAATESSVNHVVEARDTSKIPTYILPKFSDLK